MYHLVEKGIWGGAWGGGSLNCALAHSLTRSLTSKRWYMGWWVEDGSVKCLLARFSAEVYGVVGAGEGRAIVRSLTLSLAQSGGTWSGGWSMSRSIVYSLAS